MIQLLVLGVVVTSQSSIDLSSPKATVLSFVKSFESLNFTNCAKCVQGGKLENFEPMLKSMPAGYKFKMDLRDIDSKEVGNSAVVTGNLWIKSSAPGQEDSETTYFEKLSVVKVEQSWLIQPRKLNETDKNVTILTGIASVLAFGMPATTTPSQMESAPPTQTPRDAHAITLSNLKQLALGTIVYSADYNDRLPNANWQKQLEPYTKSQRVFQSPMNSRERQSPYTFNSALFGKKLKSVTKPAETVLLYEGSKGVIAFLYNSRGAVAFADGHVKLVSKQEAVQLKWKL